MRLYFLVFLVLLISFNPRTHEGCDLRCRKYTTKHITFQSTHPRGVRPLETRNHDQTKEFQSTHPRGVRHTYLAEAAPLLSFNPRTHEGCDSENKGKWASSYVFQSTHPRGVRHFKAIVNAYAHTFQSTHPRGVRLTPPFLYHTHFVFQSTHPRGVRLTYLSRYAKRSSFNPRTHEGCDKNVFEIQHQMDVSIHAPTRGATAYSAKYRILIYKSSHFANINQTITFKVIKSLEFL